MPHASVQFLLSQMLHFNLRWTFKRNELIESIHQVRHILQVPDFYAYAILIPFLLAF
uniref:Uncharacterized protein n=1 Tax=Utricularia reniformis TaxID=192314 RepID=A0A1Y0AZA5_9LAMI|nr:hypothetical protein AEK19_MT0190 [Utricularia reniformis]ART30470.1 hypothetical protein AEK19_MT0190 [Utricularia reniformis]